MGSPPTKINLISCGLIVHVSDIKLIRTDTTLDLSQKAEKERSMSAECYFYQRRGSRGKIALEPLENHEKSQRGSGSFDYDGRWLMPGTQVWELEGQLMRAEVHLSNATMKCNRGQDDYIKEFSVDINMQLIRILNCQIVSFFPKRSFQLLALFKNSSTTFSHAGKPKLDQGVYFYFKLMSLWKLQDLRCSRCLHEFFLEFASDWKAKVRALSEHVMDGQIYLGFYVPDDLGLIL
ncbi:hypothetical protein SADUNF_Sadunf03G0135700 [Salix dunnii]|uniref:Uncharacterized protein n=1 Tax=Salix dunnii TaxID=1413687 RepID=A0A835N4Q9_9ROSI|nr:hypothetical protein SADUNF_Sadunf03G0135700 [Salix dunnii]